MTSWTTLAEAQGIGHRLLKATLRCRQCSRPAGDLVGYADRELQAARFILPETDTMPRREGGRLRCVHCAGQLYLDDVEPLGRSVPLEEAGGVPFAQVMHGDDRPGDRTAA